MCLKNKYLDITHKIGQMRRKSRYVLTPKEVIELYKLIIMKFEISKILKDKPIGAASIKDFERHMKSRNIEIPKFEVKINEI